MKWAFRSETLPAFCILSALLLMAGCKKEDDSWIPEVAFQSPQYQQEFQVGEVVSVRASISDREIITFVRVYLADADFNPVSPSRTFTPGVASYELDTDIWIPDDLPESGTYYAAVHAENRINFKNKYQELFVDAGDSEFKELLIISDGGFKTIRVSGTADFEEVKEHFTLAGDFSASEISQSDQLLFLAGKNSLNLHAYSLDDHTLAWQLEPTPGNPIHNGGCLHFEELLYTTYHHQYIRGYTAAGQVGFDVVMNEMDAPERIFRHGDYVFVEVQKKNAIDPFIGTYFALTGAEKQKLFIDFDVLDFHPIHENALVVVGNKGNHGMIYFFIPDANALDLYHMNQENFNASALTDDGSVVLAGDEHVYLWHRDSGIVSTIHDKGAQMIAFERLSGSLILASHLDIEVYDYPEMVNQKTLPFSDTIFDMRIQYSK